MCHPQQPEQQYIAKGRRLGAAAKQTTAIHRRKVQALVCKAAMARRCRTLAHSALQSTDVRTQRVAKAVIAASSYVDLKALAPEHGAAKVLFATHLPGWLGYGTRANTFSLETDEVEPAARDGKQ